MTSSEYDARIVALWLLHGGSWVQLLRAHGRDRHAENFAAALHEVAEIVADHLGRQTMSAAMAWASDRIWLGDETKEYAAPPKGGLH